MKDSVYNAIILYLVIIIGSIFIKHPFFFENGYELRKNRIIPVPFFVVYVVVLAFVSLYLSRVYTDS
jgi:hypothetical protein